MIAYEILILSKDGQTYFEEEVDCKADEEIIKIARECSIPLTTLRMSPYNLVYNDLVVAIGRAKNIKGFGHYSEPNIFGARVSQRPSVMSPPSLNIVTSTLNSIDVYWDELD